MYLIYLLFFIYPKSRRMPGTRFRLYNKNPELFLLQLREQNHTTMLEPKLQKLSYKYFLYQLSTRTLMFNLRRITGTVDRSILIRAFRASKPQEFFNGRNCSYN